MKSYYYRTVLSCVVLVTLVLAAGCDDDKKSTNANPPNPTINVNLDYYVALDLETGDTASTQGIGAVPAEMDFNFAYFAPSAPHTRVFQRSGRQIAELYNRTFISVNAVDADTVSFTADLPDSAFVAAHVILIKTDAGAVYKLGNPVETADLADGCTFDYARLTEGP